MERRRWGGYGGDGWLVGDVFWTDTRRFDVFLPDLAIDLLSVDSDVSGRFNAKPNLLAANFEDDDLDLIADDDALMNLSC